MIYVKKLLTRPFIYLLIVFIFFNLQLNAQTIKLKIIETTDEHGAIFPYDFTDQKETNSSLAQVYSYIKHERANKDQEVVLLSGGDILQGTPAVYYYNFEDTKAPHLWAEMMNYMKYDAGSVGNHDIETGHPVYDRFAKQIKFPWLAANAINKKSGKPYFKPYTIIERKGIRIAVLGLITPNIPNWLPEKIWSGIEWRDMIESAREWIKIIKEKEKPDLVVGLFHAGVEYSYGNQNADSPKNENASKLVAQRIPGFDIIFVGHDHRGWNFKEKNPDGKDVLILGGTNSARDAAIANCTLTFDKPTKTWNKEFSGEIVESKNYKPDVEFMDKFQNQFEEVKKYVSRPIGTFTETLSSRDALFGNAAFTDFINQIQLELTKGDISFTAPLSMNATIDKGEVLAGAMFKLYRYENLLYTMVMSGTEIKNYLEYSYTLWFNQMKNADDHLLRFDVDDKGNLKLENRNKMPMLKNQYYSFDCAAGINYTVDVSKPIGERINILSLNNGQPFDLNKKYKVAVNSYRGNGGGGHLVNGAGIPKEEINNRIITSTEKDLRYYMMKWIEKNRTVTPKGTGNWKVIPEDWWAKGKEKDYKILFGNR
jgi:2',3'-cyclic-nucleotide 2'-phosphodiesterase / 3'-nucleotidase